MKKILSTACLAAALSFSSATQTLAEELKIATIDTKKVIEGYWKTKILKDEFKKDEIAIKKDNDERQKNIEKLTSEIEEMQKKLKDVSMSRSAREKLREKGKIKFNKLQQAQISRRDRIQEKVRALQVIRAERQGEMLKDVKTKIKEFAAKNGHDLILDKGEGLGVVLFAKQKFDITKDILAVLNKGHEDKIKK